MMRKKTERTGKGSDYQSYLLRLWRVSDGQEGWRASLESTDAGECRGFADLETLFGFLLQETSLPPGASTGKEEGGEIEKAEERR